MNAKQQLEETALQWCDVPLSQLCRPPADAWKIAALKRVQSNGGEMFSTPWLKHLFRLNTHMSQLLSRPNRMNL